MKVIIAGGRDFIVRESHFLLLDDVHDKWGFQEVVSGGARGADAGGERYARARNLLLKRFPANWDKYGNAAGFIRNEEMAEYADGVILFPGGTGTYHMEQMAKKYKLKICKLRAR